MPILPILYINISGDYDLKKLKGICRPNLKDEIESYKEISKVDQVGALTPEIQINVDLNKMAAAQLTLYRIFLTNAVGAENILSSAGTIKTDGVTP
jgi:multidrug efflux pump